MSDSSYIHLGFDPGGKRRFGWSVVVQLGDNLESPPKTGLANDAFDALEKAKEAIESLDLDGDPRVLAAGIDAPLLWNKRGARNVDQCLSCSLRPFPKTPPKAWDAGTSPSSD